MSYGFEFDFESYYPAYGEWDCTAGMKLEFTLEISEGTCEGYEFYYWYGEGGTHESKAMDEFLGEEDVTFTEETLLGLNLYFTVGDDSEIESVYLMDPVYGAVYVYGDPSNLYKDASGNSAWPWTDNAAYYDDENGTSFEDALGIYFYQSTDKVAADWTVTSSGASDYDECADPLFKDILSEATCAGEAIAIGYFECAECGTPVPVYAYKAHTFEGDGLDLEKASNASSGWVGEHSWTDATCTEAASHTAVCTDENCKQEILIYGEGKLGHSYDYAISVDEADNWIEITATCDRCGYATTVNGNLATLIGLENLTIGENIEYTVYINGEAITEKPGDGASLTVGGVTITMRAAPTRPTWAISTRCR